MASSQPTIIIRPLRPTDERSGFSCGNEDLDRFFHRYAGQNQFKTHIGVTYVAVDVKDRILGFVTVSPSDVQAGGLPGTRAKRLPSYPIPTIRLARMGVLTELKGLRIGFALVNFVFDLAHGQAQKVGCTGVLVDAKDTAIGFYLKLGFTKLDAVSGELGDRPVLTPMFIWLQDIPPPAVAGK